MEDVDAFIPFKGVEAAAAAVALVTVEVRVDGG